MNEQMQKQKADILKGLAHPVRLSIVEVLKDNEMCVCDIARQFPLDRTSVSKHLTLMKNLGILDDRKDGLHIYYSLKMKCLATFLQCVELTVRGIEPQATISSCGCSEKK